MKPTVGRIVHVVLGEGCVRPAIIVRTWNDTGDTETSPDRCKINLQVFTDGSNDNQVLTPEERSTHTDDVPNKRADRTVWRTSVPYDADGMKAGTWRWPPKSA